MPTKWTTGVLIIFLFAVTLLSGYNYVTKPFSNSAMFSNPTPVVSPTPVVTPSPEPVSAVELLQTMTPEEKIAQLLVLPLSLRDFPEISQRTSASSSAVFSDYLRTVDQLSDSASNSAQLHPGGYLLVDDSLSAEEVSLLLSQTKVVGPLSQAKYLRPIITVDHEGGTVQRLQGEGFSQLPSWEEICALPKAQRTLLLESSARELTAAGIDMVLGPVLDRATDSSVYASRICSSDPTLVSLAAADFVRAFTSAGIIPVYKHFPGIGATKFDLHKQFDSITVSPDDVALYRTMIQNFPTVPVMISHVGVKNQYANIPCSLSPDCVQELLTVFPDTVLITDALDMNSVRKQPGSEIRKLEDIVLDAVAAGDTLLLLGERVSLEDQKKVMQVLLSEYRINATFASKVDESARKIIELKLSL